MANITERRFAPKEVAAAMGASLEHVIRLISSGALPAINIARPGAKKARWRIRESDWKRFEDGRLNRQAEPMPRAAAVNASDTRFSDVIKFY